jgi:hypothetical protein
MVEIRLPDKDIVLNFPDEMPAEQIKDIIKAKFYPPKPTGPAATLQTTKALATGYGPLEAAMNLFSQTYGVPASGLAQIAGLPFGKSEKWGEAVSQALIYQPKTEAGKKVTEAVSYPFEKLADVSNSVAGWVTEKTGSPFAGTVAGTAVQVFPMVAGAKGIKSPIERKIPSFSKELLPAPLKESLYQQYIDRFASIENTVEKAKNLGAKILPGEDPYIRARTYAGVGGKVKSILQDKTYKINPDGTFTITGEGLEPILRDYDKLSSEKNLKIRQKDLNDYLISKRTIEDLQRPKGDWTTEQIVTQDQVKIAQIKLDALNKKYGNLDLFDQISDRLYSFQRRVLENLVDTGNISPEAYQEIIKLNPHYVPFNRIIENMERISEVWGGQKIPKPIKKIRGSELEIYDPIESMIINTYRIVDATEKNTIVKGISKLSDVLPDEIKSVSHPIRPIKVSPSEIDTIVKTFRNQAEQVLRETKRTGGIQRPGEQPTSAPMSKLEIIIKDSLQRRGFTEGEAEAALHRIKESARGKPEEIVSPTQVETVENTITRMITETIRTIETPVETTIFRPSPFKPKGSVLEYFENGKKKYIEVAPNIYEAVRGLNETSSNLLVKLMRPFASVLRVGATITPEFMLRNPIRDQYTALHQTNFGFKPFIDSIEAVATIIGKKDIYYDWLRSGGSYSGFVELSRENVAKMFNELKGNKPLLSNLNIISHAQDISELFEQATRTAAYKAAVEKGLSPLEAGFSSREATVDFARRGSKTKDINSIIAFFNAGIQGTDKTLRAFKADPAGVTIKGISTITIPSVMLYLLNRNDPEYKELPRWQKDLFWNFRMGDTWIRIPKPFLYGQAFGSAPERFLEYMDQKDPMALKGFAQSLLDAASPGQGDPLGTILPTAIKPLIENTTNWQFFRERPIVSRYKEEMLPFMQYGKYTTEIAKEIGRELNISPAKIENIITGYFGGTGQYGLEAADIMYRYFSKLENKEVKFPERPKELADYPLLKGFVSRPPISVSKTVQDFFSESDRIIQSYTSYRTALKTMNVEEARLILKNYPNLFKAPTLNKFKDRIISIDTNIDNIIRSKLPEHEKREKIQSMEKLKIKIAQQGNELMGIHKALNMP